MIIIVQWKYYTVKLLHKKPNSLGAEYVPNWYDDTELEQNWGQGNVGQT